ALGGGASGARAARRVPPPAAPAAGPPPAAALESPPEDAAPAPEGEEAVLRAEGLGWAGVLRVLLGLSRGHRVSLAVTFGLGVARVAALVGVGVASALTVRALARGEPFGRWLLLLGAVAPLAGLLHWLGAWLAHAVPDRPPP